MNHFERLPRGRIEATAEVIRSGVATSRRQGAHLYAALSERMSDDPELVSMAAHGLASMPALHLFSAVHDLLLDDPSDPLARYYATLTDSPAPPEQAFPDFARFCRSHRDEILERLETRTVQSTGPERCQIALPALSHVARLAGEPLNLIEIGCSAGLLLTFDKYAYQVKGGGRLGPADAPLTLNLDVRDGPQPHIPKIGKRIGLDLRPVDVRVQDERRWLLALCPPERRFTQTHLATAMDVVAKTDISFFKGDALDLLPDLLPNTPGPLCIFHSACLLYWSEEGKAQLDQLLLEKSKGREFYRVGIEPNLERVENSTAPIELTLWRYADGAVESRIIAKTTPDLDHVQWLG